MAIISQFLGESNHTVYLEYIQLLVVIYGSINLEKNLQVESIHPRLLHLTYSMKH
jgi:hypothetical protein